MSALEGTIPMDRAAASPRNNAGEAPGLSAVRVSRLTGNLVRLDSSQVLKAVEQCSRWVLSLRPPADRSSELGPMELPVTITR